MSLADFVNVSISQRPRYQQLRCHIAHLPKYMTYSVTSGTCAMCWTLSAFLMAIGKRIIFPQPLLPLPLHPHCPASCGTLKPTSVIMRLHPQCNTLVMLSDSSLFCIFISVIDLRHLPLHPEADRLHLMIGLTRHSGLTYANLWVTTLQISHQFQTHRSMLSPVL